ncbi:exodeoxyribonuclease VII large subunit [Alteraurantiacibacter palmitatis]|uniref:Exodeoxyribonuclease 7 large subunit n=1 Tax=Alteraurantiacibacter palmitatis TaxID=2054628 RepID=A0ABV7E6W1_9SPHN
MPSSDPISDSAGEGLVAKSAPGDNSAPLSITAISAALKRVVEDRFGFVRLRGELSGVKRAASGHLYCSLKDEGAVLDGVMWKGQAGRLAFVPEDGIEVVVTGKITTFAGRSKYQIVMDSMEIAGEGALLALLEKTRARLAAEGLFDERRKRPLPFIPRTIGVVTSPTGAVIRDILHRLADRFPSHVLVWPVLVQGQGAAAQVAAAVRGFGAMPLDKRPDLLIVARGGGSIEDLWAFNEEEVVRAVAASPIPVISAVGHETDTTLCDFAADRRAPTPTAAAEMAVPVRADLANALAELGLRQRKSALRPVALGRERLEARAQRLPRPEHLLQAASQRLDLAGDALRRALQGRASAGRERLAKLRLSPAMLQRALRDGERRLDAARLVPALVQRPLVERQARLAALARLAQQLHPERPLARGYAMVLDSAGHAVTSRASASRQAQLAIRFADGDLSVVPAGPKRPALPRKARDGEGGSGQEELF